MASNLQVIQCVVQCLFLGIRRSLTALQVVAEAFLQQCIFVLKQLQVG